MVRVLGDIVHGMLNVGWDTVLSLNRSVVNIRTLGACRMLNKGTCASGEMTFEI